FDINLLPDVKQEFIKSQRTKRMFIAGAFLVSAACVGLVILLFLWTNVQQKQHISNLQEDIDNYIKDLKETHDVDKILTIQNQLNALPGLHDEKPAVTRLSAFLSNVVPQNIERNEVTVSFEDNEMVISGSGIDFKSVNTFADTLKNVLYYQ